LCILLALAFTLLAVSPAHAQGAPLNPLKARLQAGQPALGMLVSMPSVPVAQILSRTGLDWLFIDMEHGAIDLPSMQAMIAATQGTGCIPLVRVGAIDPVPVKPVLDAGAFGVIFPMVKTAEEARLAAQSVRYPPAGIRGVGPHTAPARWGLSAIDYIRQANDHVMAVLLIETQEALQNLEAILAVPGIDAAIIAPFDLSASFSLPGQITHPDVQAAIAKAEQTILKSGVSLGGLALTTERANALIAKGYRLILLTTDGSLLREGTRAMLEGIRR
jgi:4-hydroxy-2-oxoheptanedioate aldolase